MNILLNTRQNEFWHAQEDRLRTRLEVEIVRAPDISAVPEATRSETIALITYGCTTEEIAALPQLRLVGVPMSGLNTLPLDLLRQRHIPVINAHVNGRWVAERAIALLLSVAGQIVSGDRDLRRGRWHGFAAGEPVQLSWRSLSEMTVAIIGTGSIGQWTAQLLRPFGPRIIGVRRQAGNAGIPDGLFDETGTDLNAAFDSADAVIVTLPSTPETIGLISAGHFRLLDRGILINVGRGDVIDEEALYRAVAAGRVSCGIDTWFTYPDPAGARHMPSRFPLESFDNVVMSPHLGGYNVLATTASGIDIADRVAAWVEAGQPSDVGGAVDLEAGY
ncbi:MAG: NAD(P)-dependent oxidoreductase [Spirochaeta sp.]|nr:NAD(P)-dependent oxidoreductase [Spirochaeta sp.]